MDDKHHSVVRLSSRDTEATLTARGLDLGGGPSTADRRADWWLEDELLLAAAALSLYNRYRELARAERLAVGAFCCVGEAIVHRDRPSPIARLVLRVELSAAASDTIRAEQVLRRAAESFLLGRALTTAVEVQVTMLPSGELGVDQHLPSLR